MCSGPHRSVVSGSRCAHPHYSESSLNPLRVTCLSQLQGYFRVVHSASHQKSVKYAVESGEGCHERQIRARHLSLQWVAVILKTI